MQESRIRTLRLNLGGETRTAFEVREGDVITIGRDPGCTIQVTHSSVSPVHCRIEYRNDSFVMVDLDSTTGIEFNGKKYKNLQLGGLMEVGLGDITMVCQEGTTAAGIPVPPLGRITPSPPVPVQGALKRRRLAEVSPGAQVLRQFGAFVKRSPAFVVSFVFHVIVFSFIADLPYIRFATYLTDKIYVDVDSVDDLTFMDETLPPEDIEFDDPPQPMDDLPELFEEELLAEETEVDDSEKILEVDPGVIGIGGGGRRFGWGRSLKMGKTGHLSADARDLINKLRQSGVDVAFVMDTTSSMEGFIAEAKTVVNRLISGLVTIVPNLRLSIVAYRDHGDEYVTQALEFSNDRYEILNFLESIKTRGGGDREEAIYEGLNRAIKHLLWRPGARKVVLLIGDSGYRKDAERQIDRLLTDFRRDGGVIHTIYVGAGGATAGTDKSVLEMFCRIAQATGGNCVHLAEHDKVFRIFLNLPFADRVEFDVAALVEKAKITRTTQFIERRARSGDRAWMLAKLKTPPVHPRLVQELMKNTTRKELLVLIEYLGSDRIPVATKQAAYYILRKTLKRSFHYNPLVPASDQQGSLDYLRKVAGAYPDKGRQEPGKRKPREIPSENSRRAAIEER